MKLIYLLLEWSNWCVCACVCVSKLLQHISIRADWTTQQHAEKVSEQRDLQGSPVDLERSADRPAPRALLRQFDIAPVWDSWTEFPDVVLLPADEEDGEHCPPTQTHGCRWTEAERGRSGVKAQNTCT